MQDKIREIAEIMKNNDLTVVEITKDGTLHMERKITEPVLGGLIEGTATKIIPLTEVNKQPQDIDQSGQGEQYVEIKSPMVGIYYQAASPEAKPYKQIGDLVQVGDVICVIEAMKLFNEITAEVSGRIAEICVTNGQIVEYDQVLFKLAKE